MEFFAKIILVIFLYFIIKGLYRLIVVGWKVRKAYKDMRNMANQMGGGYNTAGQQREPEPEPRRRTNRTHSNEEYAEFEEIIEPRASKPLDTTPYNADEWIKDAKFEEIIEDK